MTLTCYLHDAPKVILQVLLKGGVQRRSLPRSVVNPDVIDKRFLVWKIRIETS